MVGRDPFEMVSPLNPQDPPTSPRTSLRRRPFSPPLLTPELPINIEGYEIEIFDSWIRGIGYDIWERGNSSNFSDSSSMVSVLSILKSPQVINKL